jgi:aminopeptidase YwaD
MKKYFFTLIITLSLVQFVSAQTQFGFTSYEIMERLKTDIVVLSSDEFEGREAGTPGEIKAAEYIKTRMEEAGLTPLFDGSYLQEFTFSGQWMMGTDNYLIINEEEFVNGQDFFVLPNSASAKINAKGVYVGFGLETDSHNDYEYLTGLKNRIFFMEYYLPEQLDNGEFRQPLEVLQKKIELAVSKGAQAVVFVNSQSKRTDPPTSLNQRLGRESIPVFFAKTDVLEFWQQLDDDKEIMLSADISREVLTAYNVAGYIDNNAEYTVVIGGHYDHLGYGNQGSRSPGVNAIHPGADDNASGTAGVLEAARYLSQSASTNNNYLFIAFSAEEKGLLGSRHFAESDAYEMSKVNYMLNFDMLGRMESNDFTLIGTGSSSMWDSIVDTYAGNLNIRKSAGAVGGSDHTNFYQKGIPVLFFFTGLHDDYHRPSDTEDKISYDGMHSILQFAFTMIDGLDTGGKITFSEAPVTRRSAPRREGPTLGVMPDHAFDGEGLRIQSVSDNNPAQRAGLKGGDVIVRIGEVRVSDIQTYMQALGSVGTNRTIKVHVLREGKEMVMDVAL